MWQLRAEDVPDLGRRGGALPRPDCHAGRDTGRSSLRGGHLEALVRRSRTFESSF